MSDANTPLHVVAIGGGTGLSTLLHGLKRYAGPLATSRMDITAVVTVTDDGGSSGRLRRDFDVLPPGDIRNCMVALSHDEALLSRLFQYRFQSGRGLKGHSFGNLFLTAMTDITGDFAEAVKQSSEVMASAGRIYPATRTNVALEAVLADGAVVHGETNINKSRKRIVAIRLLPRRCKPLPETLDAIAQADLITLGPGSLFTSVVPNLLVSGIAAAIRKSPAVKACYVNLMWEPGETTGFRASEHLEVINRHARGRLIDYAVLNTGAIKPALRKRYARENAEQVENDVERIGQMGMNIVAADLVAGSVKVRHNPEAVAEIALRLAGEGRRRREESGHAE